MSPAEDPIEGVLASLSRLARHLRAAEAGDAHVRDDLAVALQLLVGDGEGYGILDRALAEVGAPEPTVPDFAGDLPHKVGGLPVVLAFRASDPGEGAPHVPLSDFLDSDAVRVALPGIAPEDSWSRRRIALSIRNKFGAHVDERPPQWLQELRYYPAGDNDAVTFLLWSTGRTLLAAATETLAASGVTVAVHPNPDIRYLAGVDMREGVVLRDAGTGNIDMRANVRCEQWRVGYDRALVGARIEGQPFLFGLRGDGRLYLALGGDGEAMSAILP